MELSKDTRISYLRDPKNRNRVMTVVSKRTPQGELEVAFAINRPSEWKRSYETKFMHTERKEPGDVFNKQKGLEIALGRLAIRPLTVPLLGRTPTRAVLETLRTHENGVVQRIAESKLEYLNMLEVYGDEDEE
jgi:hypothetical protein